MKYLHVHHIASPECFWVAKRYDATHGIVIHTLNERFDHAHAFTEDEEREAFAYLQTLVNQIGIVQVIPIECELLNPRMDLTEQQRKLLHL